MARVSRKVMHVFKNKIVFYYENIQIKSMQETK